MNKYQIRFVSRTSGNLGIKRGYTNKTSAEKDLRKNGFEQHGDVWLTDKYFAKIHVDKT